MIALILTAFLLLVFFGIILFFGWNLSRFVLGENKIETLIPLAFIVGHGVYSFLLNALSYLIKIQINFYLILIGLAAASYFLYLLNKRQEKVEWGIDKKYRKILFITVFILMILSGISGLRTIGETSSLTHLPLVATIAENNFPVKDVFNPNLYTLYHYGWGLFIAAIYKVTGLPLWFGFDLFNFFIIGTVFLLGFALAKSFCKDSFKAYFASLAMILGGNLVFFYGFRDLFYLFKNYILSLPTEAPFRFLSGLFLDEGSTHVTTLTIENFQTVWAALGFALTLTIIYLYFRIINDKNRWLRISLLASVLFSFLALSAEVFFGVLGIVFFLYPLLYGVFKKDWEAGKFFLKSSLLVLFLGSLSAVLQGGTITQTVKGLFLDHNYSTGNNFSITAEYLSNGLIYTGKTRQFSTIPIFSWEMFLGWGLLAIFIIPVARYFFKNFFREGLFFILLIFVSLFIPLVLTVGAWQGDLTRTKFLASLFWNFSFGLFLGWLFLYLKNRPQKILAVFLVSIFIFQGALYLVVQAAFPSLEKGQPLVAKPFKTEIETEAFRWIREQTTINDYFLIPNETQAGTDYNSRFVVLTGRLAPNFYSNFKEQYGPANASKEAAIRYKSVLDECLSSAIKYLNYQYLYVDGSWPEGIEQKCLVNNNLDLMFEKSSEKKS